MVSKETWTLVEGISDEVSNLFLSPDQSTVVFSTYPNLENELASRLFLISTPSSQQQRQLTQLTECKNQCRSIIWRQDSELFVFMDESGIYLGNPGSTRPELILKNSEADDGIDEFNVHYPLG